MKFIIDQKNRDPNTDHVGMWVCHNYATRGLLRDDFQTYRQVYFGNARCPKVLKENLLISEDKEEACLNIQTAVSQGRHFGVQAAIRVQVF